MHQSSGNTGAWCTCDHLSLHCVLWLASKPPTPTALTTCICVVLHCVFTMSISLVHNSSLAVKAEDVITNTGGSSRLHLMLVTEQPLSCRPPTIVQFPVGEHPQQCALASIHIPNYCNPKRVLCVCVCVRTMKTAPYPPYTLPILSLASSILSSSSLPLSQPLQSFPPTLFNLLDPPPPPSHSSQPPFSPHFQKVIFLHPLPHQALSHVPDFHWLFSQHHHVCSTDDSQALHGGQGGMELLPC